MTVNLIDVIAAVSTLALWGWASTFRQHGDYDFATPLFGLLIVIAPVIGWGMFYLGRWLA